MTYPRRIVALDTETTGLSSMYDKLRQIAAVVMEDGQAVSEPFYSYVGCDPRKMSLRLEALQVTCGDVSTEDGAKNLQAWILQGLNAPEPPVVAREFAAWSELVGAKDYPVVAHNAHFDHAFVEQWRFNNWRVFAVPPLSPVWICTLTLSQALHPDEKKHGLDEVCKRFGLAERPGAHDALTDALLAGAVYHRLTTDAQVTA